MSQEVVQNEVLQGNQLEVKQKAPTRKKKGRWIILGVLVGAVCIGGVWFAIKGRHLLEDTQDSSDVEIVALEGQEIIYARIESINGNEITYTVTDMPVDNPKRETERESGRGNESGEMPEFGAGEMPNFGGGEMPNFAGGERPEGSEGQEEQRLQSGDLPPDMEKTKETITAYIPVGTEVTTKLGTVTTFSRLAAGDYVALVVETDGGEQVIMAVYIVG